MTGRSLRASLSEGQLLEPLLEIGMLQGTDHLVQLALHHPVEIVKSEPNPMIGNSVLRIIIGPNLFLPSAGTDLAFARRGILGLFLTLLILEQTRAQNTERLLLVLLLA